MLILIERESLSKSLFSLIILIISLRICNSAQRTISMLTPRELLREHISFFSSLGHRLYRDRDFIGSYRCATWALILSDYIKNETITLDQLDEAHLLLFLARG